jgi:hypothetical protein
VVGPICLLGCSASIQWLVELAVTELANIIEYIDELLVHFKNQEDHMKQLEKVFKTQKCGV